MHMIIMQIAKGSGGGGVGGTPLQEANGNCHWMGSHFHDWSDYNGVAFSVELLEWGGKFSDFWAKYRDSKWEVSWLKKSESCCLLNLTISITFRS